ncbi:MAG: hypothetical protein WBG48_12750 [Pricia sp.]
MNRSTTLPNSCILFLVTLLVLLCSTTRLPAQGLLDGFMRGKGNLVTALSYSNESYDTYFVGDTKTQNPNLGTIRMNSLGIFVAGGVTDHLDVIVSAPYVSTNATQGFISDQDDFQDISLFVKGRFLNRSFGNGATLSLMAAGGISKPLSDYIADSPVSIGNQSTQWDGRLIAQYSFLQGIFIAAQTGYIKRGNVDIDRGLEVSVPDAWDYILRTGGIYKKWYADAWLQHQDSRNGTDIGPGVPFPSNDIDFTRVGFTLYHPIPKFENFGIAVGGGFTLSGTNIGKSDRFSASLIYNFSVATPSID